MAPKKKPKKPKSEAALKNDLRSRIRQLFTWYSPAYKAAKSRAQISYGLFQCEKCAAMVKEIQIDHVEPVVPIGVATSDMSLDEYFKKTFCGADNLDALCKNCHSDKSKKEMKLRVEARKND